MSIYIHNMSGVIYSEAETETLFVIAAARADGASLVRLDFPGETARTVPAAKKALRALKRRGGIQMFAERSDFEDGSTEAVFLLNKFPETEGQVKAVSDEFLYVKL